MLSPKVSELNNISSQYANKALWERKYWKQSKLYTEYLKVKL